MDAFIHQNIVAYRTGILLFTLYLSQPTNHSLLLLFVCVPFIAMDLRQPLLACTSGVLSAIQLRCLGNLHAHLSTAARIIQSFQWLMSLEHGIQALHLLSLNLLISTYQFIALFCTLPGLVAISWNFLC